MKALCKSHPDGRRCLSLRRSRQLNESDNCSESLNAAYVSRVLCPQSAAQRRCATPPLRVGLSSTPNTNPQQPDTGDERSRQACKRGVPSRPVCLSAPAELQTVNAKRCRPPRGRSDQDISIPSAPSSSSRGVITSVYRRPARLTVDAVDL